MVLLKTKINIIRRKKKIKEIILQKRGLAITALDGSLGGDRPALLTAITRNSYSFPSDKPLHAPLL